MLEPLEIISSRRKAAFQAILCLLVALIFAAILMLQLNHGETGHPGLWILIAGSLFASIMFAALARWPSKLVLDKQGFSVWYGLRRASGKKHRWCDVESIEDVAPPSVGRDLKRCVGIKFRPGYMRNLRSMANSSGSEGRYHTINFIWPRPVPEIVDDLNAYWRKAMG